MIYVYNGLDRLDLKDKAYYSLNNELKCSATGKGNIDAVIKKRGFEYEFKI